MYIVEGAANGDVFERFVRHAPTPYSGDRHTYRHTLRNTPASSSLHSFTSGSSSEKSLAPE